MNLRIQPLCFPVLKRLISELSQAFVKEVAEKICTLKFVVAQESSLHKAWCTLLDPKLFVISFIRLYSLSLGCGRSTMSLLSCSIRGGKELILS